MVLAAIRVRERVEDVAGRIRFASFRLLSNNAATPGFVLSGAGRTIAGFCQKRRYTNMNVCLLFETPLNPEGE